MFPDNFYPYGAMIFIAALSVFLALLYGFWPGMNVVGWKTVLAVVLLGNAADYFSAWFFTARLGIEYEGNAYARGLMKLGWSWFTLHKLGAVSALLTLVVLLARKQRIILAVPLALAIMFILTAIHNIFSAL